MSSWLTLGSVLAVAFAAPLVWVPVLRRLGVMDVPNERSSHIEITIRGAGLAPVTGVLTALLIFGVGDLNAPLAVIVLTMAVVMACVGLVEDVHGLPVRARIGLQLGTALVFAAVVCGLTHASWWLLLVVALAVVGYVNVTNFMDGIDGISAMHGVAAGAYFVVIGTIEELAWLRLVGLVGAAAFLAFVPWNLGRRRVFLGDVGSYLLGALVACTGVAYVVGGGALVLAVAPALPYLTDTGITFVGRVRRGEPLTEAHRSHVYQQLTQAGFSHVAVAGVVTGLTVACCVLAYVITLGGSTALAGVLAIALLLTLYLISPRLLLRARSPERAR